MGDKTTDLLHKVTEDVPPLPLKTYRWEDIRKQKVEGRYPWTHIYKPPFDNEKWEKTKNHEYEPVIPIDICKTQPTPSVKITSEKENIYRAESESKITVQDKPNLCIPCTTDYQDSEQDDSEEEELAEITTEQLQNRLEEQYFHTSPGSSKHDYELSETCRSPPSPVLNQKDPYNSTFQDRMQLQADKLKQKFKNFKEQMSKEHQFESTPCMKRKKEQTTNQSKKNKFNFRKQNVKTIDQPTTSETTVHHASRLSLPRLPSFSRSRSSSVKESIKSQSPISTSKKRFNFHFDTYPKIFKKNKNEIEEKPKIPVIKTKSAPSTPVQRRGTFPQRWIGKLSNHKKKEPPKPQTLKYKAHPENIIKETILVSLHDDVPPKLVNIESSQGLRDDDPATEAPTKMKIDNKNFIFISLHEERFPEKVQMLDEDKQADTSDDEINVDQAKIKASRKFHTMLKKMENGRKINDYRNGTQTRDDKPEPVTITEITDNCVETGEIYLSNNVQTPGDEQKTILTNNNSATIYQLKSQNINLANNDDTQHPQETPLKLPRKKAQKFNSHNGTKDISYLLSDSIFEPNADQPMTKTYIKANLEEIIAYNDDAIEPEQMIQQFEQYERFLERSRSKGSIEIENNFYSSDNSLAQLETPVPPARPSRTNTLLKKKKERINKTGDDKENHNLEANRDYGFNTFPMNKPVRPRRKFHKTRTYSNSTTNTEIKSIAELEDGYISQNIINSKQLSVSFLPLTSNNEREPITDYNLRETSSMIHLNLSGPPLPPYRAKKYSHNNSNMQYTRSPSRASSIPTESDDNPKLNTDAEIKYADDLNSTILTDIPPKRPCRRGTAGDASLPDDDRTSREVDSLPSEKSAENKDIRDANGYAVIDARNSLKPSPTNERLRKKSRRLSEFFTLPRIKAPINYVPVSCQTLGNCRLPSPSRPPRRNRPKCEPVYINDNTSDQLPNFGEEVFDFNLVTEIADNEGQGMTHLQADSVLEMMKSRPLPPPPRPTRKSKEGDHPAYSQCIKKTRVHPYNSSINLKKKVRNTNDIFSEIKLNFRDQELRISAEPSLTVPPQLHGSEKEEKSENIQQTVVNSHKLNLTQESDAENMRINLCSSLNTRFLRNQSVNRVNNSESRQTNDIYIPPTSKVPVVSCLNVSELHAGRLNIDDIEASVLVTENIDNSDMHVSDVDASISDHITSTPKIYYTNNQVNELPSDSATYERFRLSSMIPEVGSEDESVVSTPAKLLRSIRRKQSIKQQEKPIPNSEDSHRATFAQLICEILEICYSSVGQAIHSLLEQVIPEDREKRSEVQAAIWKSRV